MTENHPPRPRDITKKNPASENVLLAEERARPTPPSNRLVRVLALFEGFHNNSTSEIPPAFISSQQFPNFELVGIVATLQEPEGLFAQCGWFGDDALDWFWARITEVQSIELRQDVRFRGGMPSVWLRTAFADYVMTTPHRLYDDMWASTLSRIGGHRYDIWPIGGVPPDWWPLRLVQFWPYKQPNGVKRPALTDAAPLEQLTQQLSVESSTSRMPWVRLGAHGAGNQPGGLVTHLHHLADWDLALDGGLPPTHEPGEMKEGRASKEVGSGKQLGRSKKARLAHK